MAHGGVDVSVRFVLKQTPNTPARIESHRALFLGCIEEEWNYGIAGNVSRDVILGVVGAHLLLVDVLLENVAQYVGVDFVVFPPRTLVKVPAIPLEEVENPLKGFIRDADFGMVPF